MEMNLGELIRFLDENTFYSKPLEKNISADRTAFTSIKDKLDTVASDENCLCSLLFFLLEHLPLEIDWSVLLSTEIDSTVSSTKRKVYHPNIFPTHASIERCPEESKDLLASLFDYFHLHTLTDFLHLRIKTRPIYQQCWPMLTPYLLKTNYHQHPFAVQIFVHLVKAMRQEALSESFEQIFPVVLITLDDPSIEMKLISLDLIDHLQRFCTSTELSLYNRSTVIM